MSDFCHLKFRRTCYKYYRGSRRSHQTSWNQLVPFMSECLAAVKISFLITIFQEPSLCQQKVLVPLQSSFLPDSRSSSWPLMTQGLHMCFPHHILIASLVQTKLWLELILPNVLSTVAPLKLIKRQLTDNLSDLFHYSFWVCLRL